jgi:hypothetical protein
LNPTLLLGLISGTSNFHNATKELTNQIFMVATINAFFNGILEG